MHQCDIVMTIFEKGDEMIRAIIVVTLMLVVMLPSGNAIGQTGQIYEHPSLGIRFEASPNWERVPRPEDKMIYEVMDSESRIHVVLWYTSTEQSARGYLLKMADMKGLEVEEEPSKIRIKGHETWLLDVPGRINNAEMRTFKDIIGSIEITEPVHVSYKQKAYPLYPEVLDRLPDVPSPFTTEDGMEVVICLTRDDRYTLIPVTFENGEPLDYKTGQWYGKGRQLEVDTLDFPTLARTWLHSEKELDQTKSITGKSIDEITRIGRPGEYSGAGFMSHDEDIISVLRGDNRLVDRLGSTHPEIAKPLFHVFNLIQWVRRDSERVNVRGILYNQRVINLKFWGSKGWQESIFNDEILGYWQIEIWRELDPNEEAFLAGKYANLAEERMTELKKKLSYIHTGEMVPYYIMRYGFYEGHMDYRADPISISFIFGLKSIDEIESVFKGNLYEALVNHFTKN